MNKKEETMEVKVKEAIEFCKDEIGWMEEEIYNYPGNMEYGIMQFNKIISLLQQGEKYRQMWEDVVRYFSYMEWKDDIIEKIRQKHFPKKEVIK